MKFLVDSCISRFAVEALRNAGFEVVWVPEWGKDPGDDELIRKAFSEQFILVTADKDFGELVFVFDRPHSTIIRLIDMPAKKQGEVLLSIIEAHKDHFEKNALITADRYRVRIRTE